MRVSRTKETLNVQVWKSNVAALKHVAHASEMANIGVEILFRTQVAIRVARGVDLDQHGESASKRRVTKDAGWDLLEDRRDLCRQLQQT